MIIEKLRVKNYKSLEDVEIPLRPLTVFVGPNNSGKSNIFDCLEFLKELAFLGPQAVTRRGGFGDLVWGGDLKRGIDIELHGQIEDGKGRQRPFKYEVSLTGGPIVYSISKESFSLFTGPEELLQWEKNKQRFIDLSEAPREHKLLERAGKEIRTFREEGPSQLTILDLGDERLGIHRLHGSRDAQHRILASFASAVADWAFYKWVPQDMGSPGPARKEAQLLERGENLASILYSLYLEDRRTFDELDSYLRVAVPEIQEFGMAPTEEGRAYFRWRESGLPSDFKVKQWLSSEGTRQILALLALRFAPRLPPLLCLEEPENFIHPGLLELVADLLRSISGKTQVLVSTHSPYLLDHLAPEDLLIVEKAEGKTQVRTVSETEGVREAVKVLGLGELWYSGAIGGSP